MLFVLGVLAILDRYLYESENLLVFHTSQLLLLLQYY